MKEILVTGGYTALVDDEDYARLSQFKWCMRNGYAVHDELYLHHAVLQCSGHIDHKDRNTLNCQKSNLRPCTVSQNAQNAIYPTGKSGHRGIFKDHRGKWRGQVRVNNKRHYTKGYSDIDLAVIARDQLAKEHFGDFAVLTKNYARYELTKGTPT